MNKWDDSHSQSAVKMTDRSIHAAAECVWQLIMYYKSTEQLRSLGACIVWISLWTKASPLHKHQQNAKAIFARLKQSSGSGEQNFGFKVTQNIDFKPPANPNWTPPGSICGQTKMSQANSVSGNNTMVLCCSKITGHHVWHHQVHWNQREMGFMWPPFSS